VPVTFSAGLPVLASVRAALTVPDCCVESIVNVTLSRAVFNHTFFLSRLRTTIAESPDTENRRPFTVTKVAADDKALAAYLLQEAGVACLGGSAFGAAGKGYLRFSYAASLEDIHYALDQMKKTIPQFKG